MVLLALSSVFAESASGFVTSTCTRFNSWTEGSIRGSVVRDICYARIVLKASQYKQDTNSNVEDGQSSPQESGAVSIQTEEVTEVGLRG